MRDNSTVIRLAAIIVIAVGGIWLWNNVIQRELDIMACNNAGHEAYELRIAPGKVICDDTGSLAALKALANDPSLP